MTKKSRFFITGSVLMLALILWGASSLANTANAQIPGSPPPPAMAQPQERQGAPKGGSGSGPAVPMDTPTPVICEALNYTSATTMGATLVPGTTNIGNACDDCFTTITLPFAYRLYEQTFNTVNVSSNGRFVAGCSDPECISARA